MLCGVGEGMAGREVLRVGEVHCLCRPALAGALREAYGQAPWVFDFLARRPGVRFLHGRRPLVVGQVGEAMAVVKRLHHGGWLAPLTGDRFLTPRRALAHVAAVEALIARGIATPRWLFVAWRRQRGTVRMEIGVELVSGAKDAAECLFSLSSQTGPPGWDVMDRVGATVAALHARGVYHHDLNLRNFLITAQFEVMVLDVDKVALRPGPLAPRACRRNLARLSRSIRKLGRVRGSAAVAEQAVTRLLDSYRVARGRD